MTPELTRRIVSGLVMAIVVLGVPWTGGLPFRMLAAAIALLVYYARSEEHTSELPSLMRNSHAVFCSKQKHNPSAPLHRPRHTTHAPQPLTNTPPHHHPHIHLH